MSVCIAAVARSGAAIVFASDQMVSLETVAQDYAMSKADFLTPFWLAMWAGDDVSSIPPIIGRAKDYIEPFARNATLEQVSAAVSKSYQEEEQTRATAEVLSVFGLDMHKFLLAGAKAFGENNYKSMLQRIHDTDIGDVSLLVLGLGKGGGRICTVTRRGVVNHYDRFGYWAIGSGQNLATSSLAFRRQNSLKPIDETIYNVCEAKFRAESAGRGGVGKTTTLGILTRNGPRLIPLEQVQALRAQCEKHCTPPIPDSALTMIREWLGAKVTPEAPPIPARSKRGRKTPN